MFGNHCCTVRRVLHSNRYRVAAVQSKINTYGPFLLIAAHLVKNHFHLDKNHSNDSIGPSPYSILKILLKDQ